MKKNITLKQADIEDLKNYKAGLIEIMEYSVKLNSSAADPHEGSIAKYDKLMGYFEQGKAKVWLAFEGIDLLGYAQYFLKENGRVHLNEIAVGEHCQNCGIGTKLIKAVEKSALEIGSEMVELFCSETNDTAKNFYGKNKYQTEKRLFVKKLCSYTRGHTYLSNDFSNTL